MYCICYFSIIREKLLGQPNTQNKHVYVYNKFNKLYMFTKVKRNIITAKK